MTHPRLRNSGLKLLEKKYLYNFLKDELYEIDDDAFNFLSRCTGRSSLQSILNNTGISQTEAEELIQYLISESCVENSKSSSAPERFEVQQSTLPSLRYLQMHITEKCNLNCRHCYLGAKIQKDINLNLAMKVIAEFGGTGLKLLITGGEPLLCSHLWKILAYARKFPVRVELLSNGILINEAIAKRLSRCVHCLQISLDGMQRGHEFLRGEGSFLKTIQGIKSAAKYLPVSIATMIHSRNLDEFEEMAILVEELGAKEWLLDVPSPAGSAKENEEIIPDYVDAIKILKSYGFGYDTHSGDEEYSCGSHLCSVHVDGSVSKCGFFRDAVGSAAEKPLELCWRKVVAWYTPKTKELECSECKALEECRGGCRYRALVNKGLYSKDLLMCRLHLWEATH